MNDLKDRRIIVTGASRGLGSVCARNLASCGARLVLIARSHELLEEVRLSSDNPEKHLCLPVDLMEMEELHKGIEKAVDFLGNVDAVLHVAGGGLGLRDPLLGAPDFLRLFTFNVVIASEINRLVLPGMMKRKSGNLVHIASIASSEATASVGYNTVKAALAAYVRSLGREAAPSGVVVTGILPGGFFAPGNSWERLQANRPEVVESFISARLPRGSMGRAEELVPLILLLCSPGASMMGGCLVPVDAGEGLSYLANS